jgi:hypothetical protein
VAQSSDTDKAFQQFWKVYPRQVGSTAAAKAFRDLVNDQGFDPEYLIARARDYAESVDPKDLRYVPQPAGWLRDGRYDDTDLFTDQVRAKRQFFTRAWRYADVKALYDEYGLIYKKPAPPDGLSDEELKKWDIDQKKLWIAEKAREYLGDSART